MAGETETFNIGFNFIRNLPVECIIPRIINHYIDGEDSRVKEKLAESCQKPRLSQHMSERIRELNVGVVTNEGMIPPRTSSIVIPTSIIFFRSAFQTFRVLGRATGQVRIDSNTGVLNRLEHLEQLEGIVRNLSSSVIFGDLNGESRRVIRTALHEFRIYTAPRSTARRRLRSKAPPKRWRQWRQR